MDVNKNLSRSDPYDAQNPIGLDAFSSDGQQIGRVAGHLQTISAEEASMERGEVDLTDAQGKVIGPRHLVIDGHGYITQVQIIVPEGSLLIDYPGRRATLNLTVAQIREMPHYDASQDNAPPLNQGTAGSR